MKCTVRGVVVAVFLGVIPVVPRGRDWCWRRGEIWRSAINPPVVASQNVIVTALMMPRAGAPACARPMPYRAVFRSMIAGVLP